MVTISALLIDPHRMTYEAFTRAFVADILAVVRPVATLAAARAEVGAVTPDLVLFEPKVADGDVLEALPLFAKSKLVCCSGHASQRLRRARPGLTGSSSAATYAVAFSRLISRRCPGDTPPK